MEINELLVVAMMLAFVILLLSGFPVAWILGGLGVLFTALGYLSDQYLDTVTGLDYNTLGLAVGRIFGIMDNWVLVAIPMFIMMGLALEKSGIAERLMLSMQQLFGGIRGGLAITVTLIGIILAASTGIIGASVVLLGIISLPVMFQQGYEKPLALGTVAAAGCLGILIPPSIMLVIMGDQLSLPVGDLFMGAVFPGLILGGLYIVYIVFATRNGSHLAAAEPKATQNDARLVWRLLRDILPVLALVLLVLGSIFTGIATVTEASGVGAAGSLLLAASHGELNLEKLRQVVIDTFNTTAYIFAIFVGATMFSLVMRELGGDELIESAFRNLSFGNHGTLIAMLLVVFLLGFLLDWIEITLIVLPLLAPVISGMDLAVDGHGVVDNPQLVWFALLVALTLQTSFLTPPVGFALFYLKGVCPPDVSLKQLYRGVVPFIFLQLAALALIVIFPNLVTWLPAVAYGQ